MKHDLFIVDNSISGWTGKKYLEDWCGISTRFDIATGFFEIGALLELDGEWQKLEGMRILMGSETTARTHRLLRDTLTEQAQEKLDGSMEREKAQNPFLRNVPAIKEALQSGKIQCRVYDKGKFHAKAYITHAKLEVVGSKALVGSSNFTRPGLTQNIELNIQVQSAQEVERLQDWYEEHWEEATDITEAILSIIERQTRPITPFEIYAKALHEYFKGHELSAGEWERSQSKMFEVLDRYQQEAYGNLMQIAQRFGGAFLCDGVGLGKTFVGLMLIERMVIHENKRVVLFAPKSAKEGVWEPHVRDWLPHVGGGEGGGDFSNLVIFSHTDLTRNDPYPERFRRVAEMADVVIIDEAHHFRNTGTRGNPEENIKKSRYYELFDLLDKERHNAKRRKQLFMLTATPVNNRLSDFRHMVELFTRKDDQYFAGTLGVNNLTSHFNALERALRNMVEGEGGAQEHMQEAMEVLFKDSVFPALVVQRSRAYARASQKQEKGEAAAFPNRDKPQVAAYSIKKSYGGLVDMFEDAFNRKSPLFTLAMYYPLGWYTGDDETINPLDQGRQKQVVSLIRTNFLKRFESSIVAFESSCERLLKKLMAFVEVHADEAELKRYERWKKINKDVLGFVEARQLELFGDVDEEDAEQDLIPEELLSRIEPLSREDFKVDEMIDETILDMDGIVKFLDAIRGFTDKQDDKFEKLLRLLQSKELKEKKVLIFTEFADTARYLTKKLRERSVEGVFQIDSGTKGVRADFIKRFAPYYNGLSSAELKEQDKEEIRILIATDVLAEGLNLQDATRMINYDIHWNPVRLMQRIGRVDRRMNPAVEARIIADHPELKAERGQVKFWNFLPPEELNSILSLYAKVTSKTLRISKTMGIEGKKLLTPDDEYEAIKEFNAAYEGVCTREEEMHLHYQQLLQDDAELEEKLNQLPGAVYSGRKKSGQGLRGVFLCYRLPAMDTVTEEFSIECGPTKWYFYDLDADTIKEEAGIIDPLVRSDADTPRERTMQDDELVEVKSKLKKHIKNTYLKAINAPIGANEELVCWMETH